MRLNQYQGWIEHEHQQQADILQKEQLVLCDVCNEMEVESLYIVHWERCKLKNKNKKVAIEKYYPEKIVQKVKQIRNQHKKSKKDIKQLSHQNQFLPVKYTYQSKNDLNPNYITCTYCGQLLNLIGLDFHNCPQNITVCEFCEQEFPQFLMSEHKSLCIQRSNMISISLNQPQPVNFGLPQLSNRLDNMLMLLTNLFSALKKQGLTQQQRNKLNISNYKITNNQIDKCTICYDNMTEGIQIIVLPCKHIYHPECIKKWLSQNTSCPNCKSNVKEKQQKYTPK